MKVEVNNANNYYIDLLLKEFSFSTILGYGKNAKVPQSSPNINTFHYYGTFDIKKQLILIDYF